MAGRSANLRRPHRRELRCQHRSGWRRRSVRADTALEQWTGRRPDHASQALEARHVRPRQPRPPTTTVPPRSLIHQTRRIAATSMIEHASSRCLTCHRGLVTFWLALRRLLPLLAVLSLALAPVTASAAAGHARAGGDAGHMHGDARRGHGRHGRMAMDDMPCCPNEKPAMPDCSKGCPLMALCLAKVTTRLPAGLGLPCACRRGREERPGLSRPTSTACAKAAHRASPSLNPMPPA